MCLLREGGMHVLKSVRWTLREGGMHVLKSVRWTLCVAMSQALVVSKVEFKVQTFSTSGP